MSELEKVESETKTDLTRTQKESGQYPKGKITLKNIPITIENPKGSIRSGYSKDGTPWESKLLYTYGYIDDSVGADGDEVDVFLGPLADTKEDFLVYIINQIDPITGAFDEHKVMFGFSNSSEAKKAYLSCYEPGWKGYGSMSQISLQNFPLWIEQEKKQVFTNQLNTDPNELKSIKLIKLEGEVIEGKTLLNLQEQAGDLTGIKTLVISIGSPGGDVSEGIRIMMWFDYLSSIGIKVVTFVVSNAYSIASLIMLAADYILIAKDADVMVHNPMVPNLELVNANDLELYIKDLRELESTMYDLYEIFTNLSIEEIKKLMDNETYLSADDAVKYGFADQIANIEKRPKVMAQSKLKLVNMKKTLNILNQVIALVGGSEIVNQSYYDDKGGEIEIYQQDPSCYSVGDRTSVESGSVKLQDGSVLTIEDYVVKTIDKAAPVEQPIGQPPVQASFNEGPAPATEPAKEETPKPEEPKPVEMKTEVTKTETTKTEPIAVKPVAVEQPASPGATPVVVDEPAKEKPVAVEPEKVEEVPAAEKPKETIEVPLKEYEDLVNNYKELKNRVDALYQDKAKVEEQMKASNKFEEVATEAIKMIAQNTSSNFKPAAKATVGEEPKGSIFQQARARVEQAKNSKQ
jgi:ATP-dependent protease ClpP protease subunit